ncbi:DUF1643 domain-containing protein [Paracoccus sp. MC1862]|uniref:DUF1643 domain-containing protein n=1 Tax=Paracoccus sp. MC1862 TaxID=2760307 RepID=UPI0016005EDA|nr:DUF1643 domain-containing protein [Paracoccus sp. MC1862]MBB1498714.1 DUF1643 domain-containing protein [Paracoccus sp. MC1862]QQO45602.1 DUF1643 domain-containing protein [Paracoccus sp. MC1862]
MALIRRHQAGGVESEAVFSDCERYRYALTRAWDAALPRLVWVMLNPSTADERRNDPTIARCEARSRAMGCGAYRIVNLYAFRATYPKDLRTAVDPVGEGNDAALQDAAAWARRVICGWGMHAAPDPAQAALALFRRAGAEPLHLGLTKAGQPRHPLHLAYTVAPQPFAADSQAPAGRASFMRMTPR